MSQINKEFKHFENFLDGVLVLDESGNIKYCNNTMSTLINVPVKRIKSDVNFADYVTFSPKVFKTLQDVSEPTPYKEVVFKSKTGKTGKVQVSAQRVDFATPGEPPLWLLYVRDVTLEATLHTKYHGELSQKEHVIKKLESAQTALKEYSKSLETKVKERTEDLAASNRTLSAMVDSLGQGFVVVAGPTQKCSKTFSRISLKLFEADPSDKELAALLKVPPDQRETFANWFNLLFEEPLPFNNLKLLGPKTYPHSKGLHIALEFHPVRDAEKRVAAIVVVATDKTDEMAALREAEREQARARCTMKLAKDKNVFWRFLSRAEEAIAGVKALFIHDLSDAAVRTQIKTAAHTLKGEANIFSMLSLAQIVHELEESIKVYEKEGGDDPRSLGIKVSTCIAQAEECLREFVKEYEPVLGKRKTDGERQVELPHQALVAFYKKLDPDSVLAHDFEEELLKEPVATYFKQYDELVETVSKKMGKKVNPIKMSGGEIKIHPDRYMTFFETFVHIVTNSVVHGIEDPEERKAKGKAEAGTITVNFSYDPNQFELVVTDDGNGIDPQIIRKKLSEKTKQNYDNENDEQIIQHIFDDDFSTAAEVTGFAGRGVGLAAVKKAVTILGGQVVVYSTVGQGTRFEIIFPNRQILVAA